MAKNAKTTSMATLTKPGLRLEVQDGGRFFADPCTSFTEKFRTRSSHFSMKISMKYLKKNRNKGICCYMCCNHFTVEAFNVCCSWNILTVTENIVNFKHLPRIFWGSEIRVGAKLLILRIDEVTGICKAFYFGADREKSAKFITMQNGSQPTSRAARENSLSRKSYYEWG